MRLQKLEGKLTRRQRVAVAKDVILRLKADKIIAKSGIYFEINDNPFINVAVPGEFTEKQFVGKSQCMVCARGAMFLSSVSKYDNCYVEKGEVYLGELVCDKTIDDFGHDQIYSIEDAFESRFYRDRYNLVNDEDTLIHICQNIIYHHGEFVD